VTLTGSHRLPLGMLGTELDRLLLRAVATATIRTLLARIAATLEGAPVEALPEHTTAVSLLDNRLLHHAHLCQTSGDSVRLTQALAGKGVILLAT
jgi:hypothetical protein